MKSVKIVENFDQDIKEYVFSQLPLSKNELENLKDESPHSLLVIYYNWLQRIPEPRKRQVLLSEEINHNKFFTDNKSVILNIKEKLEKGEDIKAYLSARVNTVHKNNSKPNSSDKDLLLNDWGIYHLHLGETIATKGRRKGFVKGLDELLFAVIKPDKAYFIDILDHNSWTETRLLEIIQNNWPALLTPFECKNIIGLEHDCTREEHEMLREAGINVSAIKVNDKYYIPPAGGITTTGHNVFSVMNINKFFKQINGFKRYFENEKDNIQELIKKQTNIEYNLLELKLIITNEGVYFIETNSNSRFDINPETQKLRITIPKKLCGE